MQEKSLSTPYTQQLASSSPTQTEKSLSFKKTTSNFLVTLTQQTEYQGEQGEFDLKGAIDYDDLSNYSKYKIGEDSTQEREQIYLNFAKILQKKVMAKMDLKTTKANLRAETVKKQKLEAQLESLAKSNQFKSEQAKLNIQKQLENLRNEISFQQEIKKSLNSELEAWKSLNKANQDQIKLFPHQIKDHLPEMQKCKLSLHSQKQKIVELVGLQEVFLSNIEQILSEFP